jgi:hypothetical protein
LRFHPALLMASYTIWHLNTTSVFRKSVFA